MTQLPFYTALTALAGALMQVTTCSAVIEPGDGGGNGGGDPADTEVLVRFVNLTGRALDVQFFATAQPLGDPETVLFLPENQRFDGLGFAGRGVLQERSTDELTLSCEEARSIGTRGGWFIDSETGEPAGTGTQRVASQGQTFNCGETVTFTFRSSGGTFTTELSVE